MGVIHRSALVFPHDGFIGAIIRSIALGVRQLSARRQGHEVFQHVDKALSWVIEGLPTPRDLVVPVPSLVRDLGNYTVSSLVKVA